MRGLGPEGEIFEKSLGEANARDGFVARSSSSEIFLLRIHPARELFRSTSGARTIFSHQG